MVDTMLLRGLWQKVLLFVMVLYFLKYYLLSICYVYGD
ncbi:Uncharacterised protein [Yersinia frederiksenii]|nr:Uncharacterised protein [Yersinia frederiksenii]